MSLGTTFAKLTQLPVLGGFASNFAANTGLPLGLPQVAVAPVQPSPFAALFTPTGLVIGALVVGALAYFEHEKGPRAPVGQG